MPNRIAFPLRSKQRSNKMSKEIASRANLGWNSASSSMLNSYPLPQQSTTYIPSSTQTHAHLPNAATLSVPHLMAHPLSFYYPTNNVATLNLQPNIFDRQSIEDLEKEFEKLAIEIPPDFWKNPKSEDIHGLYSIALEEVFNLKLHDIRREEVTGELNQDSPTYTNMHILSYDGRLHLRALGNLRFFRYCQRLCWYVLGISNFNREYLFKPTPTTVITFANAFVTFLKFREMVYIEHSEQFQEMNKKADEDVKLDENLRVLQIDLNQFQSHVEQKQLEIFQYREEYTDLIKKLQELSIEYIEFKKRLSFIQEKVTYTTNNEKDTSLKLAKLHYQRDALKDQIAPSPEKLMQRNAEIKQQIERVFHALHSNEESVRKCMETFLLIEKSKKRLLKTEEMLQIKCEPLLQAILTGRSTVKSHRAKLTSAREQEERLLHEGESLDQTVIQLQALYQERQEEWDARIEQGQDELHQAQLRLQQRQETLRIQSTATDTLNVKAKQLIAQIHALTEEHAFVLEHMDQCIQNLMNCYTAFMTEFQKLQQELVLPEHLAEDPINKKSFYNIKKESSIEIDENQLGSLNQHSHNINSLASLSGNETLSRNLPLPRL